MPRKDPGLVEFECEVATNSKGFTNQKGNFDFNGFQISTNSRSSRSSRFRTQPAVVESQNFAVSAHPKNIDPVGPHQLTCFAAAVFHTNFRGDQLTGNNETRRRKRQGLIKNKNLRWYKKALHRKIGVYEPQERRKVEFLLWKDVHSP